MRDRESGFVLLAVLVVLLGTISLSAAGLSRSLLELTAAERFIDKQQAFQQAEAAVDDALATLTATPTLTLPYTMPTSTTTSSAVLGSKTYTIMDLGNRIARITASGSSDGNVSQTIEVVVQLPASEPFQQAIFGDAGLQVNKDTVVDSYNSTLGAYTPAPATGNRSDHADLRTNSTDVDAVSIHQDTVINGDVIVGAGGTPSVVINNAGTITGDQTAAGSNLALDPITVPPGSPCGSSLTVLDGQTVTLDVGSFCHSSVSIGDGGRLILNGDGQITLGDSAATDLNIPANATLEITGQVTLVTEEVNLTHWLDLTGSGAKLDLYVTHSMSMEGVINTSTDPTKLLILYDGTDKLTMTKDGDFYGAIYAPNAKVEFNKDGNFYGAVVAQFFYMKKDGGFHFDEALLDTPISSNSNDAAEILSWRQP
ncbi:MAG: hypothetical protein HY599_00555 [Candidatus Omnitrophica bacterium]|nr:hypothetical protein [Candidatus Omnitrophota bacterium]